MTPTAPPSGSPGSLDEAARGKWSRVAQCYADTFAVLCSGTFPLLLRHVRPGSRVLDVGCGTGALSLAAAGRGARVTALDAEDDMVAMTRQTVAPAATPVEVLRAALPDLPLADGSFDLVLANFVVNHLPDPRAGARELARVTAPGGRAVVTIWPTGQTVQSRLFAAIVEEAGAVVPPGTTLPPALDFPRSTDGLAGILTEAGFGAVEADLVAWEWRVLPAVFWSGIRSGMAATGKTYVTQPPEVRAAMDAAFERLSRPLLDGAEMVLPSTAVVAVADR